MGFVTKNFPIMRSLLVENYGLYPGKPQRPGLFVDFKPGATLVLGANGLGKTTLVRMMFRLLTGAEDIPGIDNGEKLGFRRLSTSSSKSARSMFSKRVKEVGASKATLSFSLGDQLFHITRRLSDLSLVSLRFNDETVLHDDEDYYRKTVTECSNLANFADFVLLLRYLIFYFEDRRQLVWDPTAQIQICRILFLDPEMSESWANKERALMKKDSDLRNKRSVMSRTRDDYHRLVKKSPITGSDLRAELAALEAAQSVEVSLSRDLRHQLNQIDRERQSKRLHLMEMADERESTYRELEHAQFISIKTQFPNQDETARYLISHLIASGHCLTCDRDVPEAAEAIHDRISKHSCIFCDTPLPEGDEGVVDLSSERMKMLGSRIAELKRSEENISEQIAELQASYKSTLAQASQLNFSISRRVVEIDVKAGQIPPDEGDLAKAKSYYDVASAELEVLQEETLALWKDFKAYADSCRELIIRHAPEISSKFEKHLNRFLAESASLTWELQPFDVGQYVREKIEFNTFSLDMSGSDFAVESRRTNPQDVSESQREFIDLSFRMALMSAASTRGTSLIIDTPEASLDGVFAKRAAQTLIGFAFEGDNTLMVASNYVDGDLLPSLLEGIRHWDTLDGRLVDLLEIARPTAAVRDERQAYVVLRDKLIGSRNGA